MTRQEIALLVGVGRNAVGEWIRLWQDGGVSALKVGSSGKPKGSGSTLNNYQQSRISKMLVERVPDQLKIPFALWNREAGGFMFYEGSMNSDCLIKFMRRLIKDAKRKIFLILDNLQSTDSSLQKSERVSREKASRNRAPFFAKLQVLT